MVYKCLHDKSPIYLKELIQVRQPNPNRTLRIDNDNVLLIEKALHRQDYKNRGFSIAASRIWNKLPKQIRNSQSITIFKSKLKTFFYTEWTNCT